MILYAHHPSVAGFALNRDEPMEVGDEVRVEFRGHARTFRCTSVWQESDEGREDVAKLVPATPWRRVRRRK
ncbi:MAG TPA: hypothetical protein VJP77_05660 [Planctomycetota bacterium]|nr:hypothetical protein [Planctomycetota bacterium]